MKNICSLIAISLLLAAGACTRPATKASADTDDDTMAETTVAAAAADTALTPNIPFEYREFEKEKGNYKLEVAYPTAGNPELVTAVRTWINEQLTGTYKGSLDDPEAFFRHYSANLGEDPDLNEYGGYTIDEFEPEWVNDFVVTYDHTSYIYEGGAHGSGGSYGTTFLQADGTIFTKNCFTSYKPLHKLFVEGLKRYFKVGTDAELMEQLLGVKTLAKLAPPAINPWIVEGGVVFSYTPYEIAPYSAGSPHFTIPFADLEPYLTADGKRFFGI